ncbi:MAG: tetratricopeptide repeat protein [Thermoplasmata archaeon]|nr:tetratricopeptide repeat protein [Thermoplasmata archaeon]
MSGRPVLQSTFEYRMWKTLDGGAFPKGGPTALVRELEGHDGTVNSTVLVMLIDALAASGEATPQLLRTVVSHSRATDCLPSVRACEVLLEAGDAASAGELLAMSEGSQEVVARSLAEARLLLARGDRDGAGVMAGRVYGYDPSRRGAYAILAETDPEGGWPQRENIQDIVEGGKPTNPAGRGPMQELYSIYYEWFTGRRDAATEQLVRNPLYSERDPEFLLASARMSVDEKDWHSASMVYAELLGMEAPPFVYVEAAEAALGAREPARALDLLSKADPRQHRVQRDTVRARLLLGDTREMLDAIRVLLDNETSGSEEYLGAVRFLIDRGLEREAASILDRYSRFSGEDSGTYTMRSVMLMRSGDYVSAAGMARKAVRTDKADHAARAQLARILHLMGKRDAADGECSAVLSQDPSNHDALALRRDIEMAEGDYEHAASTCRKLIEASPGDSQSMLALAVSLGMTGDQTAAHDAFRAVLRTDSSRESAVSVVSAMVSCGMNRDAVSTAESLERRFPRDAMLKRLRGNALYASGDYIGASVAFADAAAISPSSPVLWHSKGMADEARGDLESAEDAYGRAVMLDQGEPEFWISKASVQARTRDRHGAVESLNRAIELDPGSVQALVMKANILSSASRHREALQFIRRAEVVLPDEVRLMDLEAGTLASMADSEGAVAVLRRRLSKQPSPEASVRLARLLVSSGDRDGALAELDSALAADPDEPSLTAERERIASGTVGPRPAPEPEPEAKPEAPRRKEDPAALAAMASSLLAAGDVKGAMRNVDRALIADPESSDLICLKSAVALAGGDVEGAAFIASSALRTRPKDAGLHRALSLAREAKGDLQGALTEIDMAIANGMDGCETHMIKGRILSASGQHERAADSYGRAVSADPENTEAAEELARQKAASGDHAGAMAAVSRILRRDPARVSAMVLGAELCRDAGDVDGAVSAYERMARCPTVSDEARVRMVRILEEMGLRDEARALMGGGQKPAGGYDSSVKRYAEKALRRAYTTRTSATDPDILDALGLDPGVAAEVSRYLSERPDVGQVSPSSPRFAELERVSHDVIVKMKWDPESDPDIPLEKVFVAGGFRDADAAREAAAYIRKAMMVPVQPSADERLTGFSMALPKGMSVYEVMRQCDLGVYEARVVRSMIV